MLVSNSFDLWQNDTFFSAAEEVQQSADLMESAYRKWLGARREGLPRQHLDEISRGLQTALSTAKWQLEEFEMAACQSYRNNGDDITVTRHRQFVSAIEDQISHVETALKASWEVEGKEPFRLVNLDEEECDDLAHFLSGSQTTKGEKVNTREDCGFVSDVSSKMQCSNTGESSEEIFTSVEANDENSHEVDRVDINRRTWISGERNVLEIVIDSDNRNMNASIEATPKGKGSKASFWRPRGEMRMINWINHRWRGDHGSQRRHVSPVLPVKSIRFLLAFLLTIFLAVPFLLHST